MARQWDKHLAVNSINGEQTWSAMTPVYKLILPLNCLSQLRRPVAVLFLVHKEINTLPHKLLICWLQVLIVRKQHLKDWWKSMCCTCKEQQSREEGGFRTNHHITAAFSSDLFPFQGHASFVFYIYFTRVLGTKFPRCMTLWFVANYFCLHQFLKLSRNMYEFCLFSLWCDWNLVCEVTPNLTWILFQGNTLLDTLLNVDHYSAVFVELKL